MTHTMSKLAAVAAVAIATALSATAADARPHHRAMHRGTETRELYRSYDYAPELRMQAAPPAFRVAPAPFTGFHPEPNGPDNYNPNEG